MDQSAQTAEFSQEKLHQSPGSSRGIILCTVICMSHLFVWKTQNKQMKNSFKTFSIFNWFIIDFENNSKLSKF